MVALRASRLVCSAISEIRLVTSPISVDVFTSPSILSTAPLASVCACPAILLDFET